MTYKKIVHKIIHDPAYARETADLIAKARRKDQAAIRELKKRFKPLPAELAEIGFKPEDDKCRSADTDPTTWRLIDFAAFVK